MQGRVIRKSAKQYLKEPETGFSPSLPDWGNTLFNPREMKKTGMVLICFFPGIKTRVAAGMLQFSSMYQILFAPSGQQVHDPAAFRYVNPFS